MLDWTVDALADLDTRLPDWRFEPHGAVRGGHAQTFAGALWRRQFGRDADADAVLMVDVAPDTQVRLRCAWQADRHAAPTMLVVHGLEGDERSCYVLGTADKAFAAGWNAIRMNIRTCGGTEALTPTLYHSGMSGDVAAVVRHLVDVEGLREVAVVGFSLGGNLVAKMTGELGREAPEALLAIALVSPAIDLSAAAARLERRANVFYQFRFVRSLRARIREKDRLFPGVFDVERLRGMRSVRDYDGRYIAPLYGFRDAEDYYERASARHVLPSVAVPALVLHADDDPFVPWTDRIAAAARSNPLLRTVETKHGGHVGFIASKASRNGSEDAHWAENRVVEFLNLMAYNRARSRAVNPPRALVPYS